MDLKTTVEKFYDDVNKKRINENGLSEAFLPVAEKVLSGYFKVSKNRSDSFVTVHPTCVELYYHEEGAGSDKVKDYTVYHRDSDDGKKKVSVFPMGVLHNHVSGIDITFEKIVEGLSVRFSALIREFWVDKSHKTEKEADNYGNEKIIHYSESNPEKRSTYLYEALYSQYSVFDGFSVEWIDGAEEDRKTIFKKTRLNVAEYEKDQNSKENKWIKIPKSKANGATPTKNGKYQQCSRTWSYSINKD